jgi:integrase/recombinase XerD
MTRQSVQSYASNLNDFLRHLERLGVSEVAGIDKDVIREYIRVLREERRVSMATIENHMSTISSFLDYLVFEGILESNVALAVRKRYLKRYKNGDSGDAHSRKLVTTEQLKLLIDSIMIPRDKAIILLLAKTGIRRGELISIDVDDVDIVGLKIMLKRKAKRSNRLVFFDEECAKVLQNWLRVRERYARDGFPALFITETGGRLEDNGVYLAVTKHAARVGLHDEGSLRLEDHFTPHCLRHWFTTHLLRNGMPREMVKELRGDARKDAIDIYNHIDEEQLRRLYLASIPKIGVN